MCVDGAEAAGSGEYEFVYEDLAESEFWNDVSTWVGKEVTVSADVREIINENSFTIAGTENTDVDELLVVSANAAKVSEDQAVKVTGTVREGFDVVNVEEELGVRWDDEIYANWDDQHYLEATGIDTSVSENEG
ncbi:hypothetical protein CUT44_30940 [Streptomyces carminius]|uniref:Uncharacterized protein n=1 Tax=Streptomyces carminius TaxID=2665496 RepID=A0A2M8LPR7_9ACTN|nr:hypothetical protein [Streptomyces carminius]PJE93964.1 hypothetical protein CUT44_30940 [Streptomyces carminius]